MSSSPRAESECSFVFGKTNQKFCPAAFTRAEHESMLPLRILIWCKGRRGRWNRRTSVPQ